MFPDFVTDPDHTFRVADQVLRRRPQHHSARLPHYCRKATDTPRLMFWSHFIIQPTACLLPGIRLYLRVIACRTLDLIGDTFVAVCYESPLTRFLVDRSHREIREPEPDVLMSSDAARQKSRLSFSA